MISGDTIVCDCCGTEKLAKIVGGNLVITDRRHGQKHIAVLKLQDILELLRTASDNSS